jgi:hypothetical protein
MRKLSPRALPGEVTPEAVPSGCQWRRRDQRQPGSTGPVPLTMLPVAGHAAVIFPADGSLVLLEGGPPPDRELTGRVASGEQ